MHRGGGLQLLSNTPKLSRKFALVRIRLLNRSIKNMKTKQ